MCGHVRSSRSGPFIGIASGRDPGTSGIGVAMIGWYGIAMPCYVKRQGLVSVCVIVPVATRSLS